MRQVWVTVGVLVFGSVLSAQPVAKPVGPAVPNVGQSLGCFADDKALLDKLTRDKYPDVRIDNKNEYVIWDAGDGFLQFIDFRKQRCSIDRKLTDYRVVDEWKSIKAKPPLPPSNLRIVP